MWLEIKTTAVATVLVAIGIADIYIEAINLALTVLTAISVVAATLVYKDFVTRNWLLSLWVGLCSMVLLPIIAYAFMGGYPSWVLKLFALLGPFISLAFFVVVSRTPKVKSIILEAKYRGRRSSY